MLHRGTGFLIVFSCLFLWTSCSHPSKKAWMFSLEQDKQLGLQLKKQIESEPGKYPVLDQKAYPEAYAHLNRIKNSILNSGQVKHKNDFKWELKIIKDDKTLNAFAAPGGYIYVYTGLIKYLDSEEHLAGVLGHEIAHADLRHSSRMLQQRFGIQILMSVLTQAAGTPMLAKMAGGLTSLTFSRKKESEADNYSVIYLCDTKYNADGAAGFFEKLESEASGGRPPAFLSTHPNPANRIAKIRKKMKEMSCGKKSVEDVEYERLKNSLPR